MRLSAADFARAGGHSMAAVQGGVRFDKIAEKWHTLAQRRLAHIRELEHSGRWRRFYTEEQFGSCLREAERAATLWARLANQRIATDSGNMLPAA